MEFGHAVPTYDSFKLAFCKGFLCEMVTSYQSVKIFSLESFPLNGNAQEQ